MALLPVPFLHAQVDPPAFVRTIGGVAPEGQLNSPLGVAVSPGSDGRIFVVDHGNARIQVFTGTGSPIGAWGRRGNGPGQFFDPTDVTVSHDGKYVYVVDRGLAKVKRFQPDPSCFEPDSRDCFSGSSVLVWGYRGKGDGGFAAPTGIGIDDGGNVYVADWMANEVQKFGPDGVFLQHIGEPGQDMGQLMRPTDVEIAPDGRIWVADRDNNRIAIFRADGTPHCEWTNGGKLYMPTGVALDSAGGGVVRDYDGHRLPRVWRFSADLQISDDSPLIMGSESSDESFPFQGVALLKGGGAVLTDAFSSDVTLFMLAPAGEIVRLAGRGTEPVHYDAPMAVALDENNYVLADSGNRRVMVLDSLHDDVASTILAAPDYDFRSPRAVAIQRFGPSLPEAVIYIADPAHHMVVLAGPDGEYLGAWGDGTPRIGGDGLRGPRAVAVSPNGDVFIADTLNNRIVHRAAYGDGSIVGVFTGDDCPQQLGELQYPMAVAVGADGTVYTLEQERNRLRAFTSDGACLGVVADGPPMPPSGDVEAPEGTLWMPVALAADDKYVYVLENDNLSHMRVQVFAPQLDSVPRMRVAAVFGETIGPNPGEMWQPRGIAASSDGQVLIADTGNNRLQLFRWPGTGPTPEPTRSPTPTRSPRRTPTATEEPVTVIPPPRSATPTKAGPTLAPSASPTPFRGGRSPVYVPMLLRP